MKNVPYLDNEQVRKSAAWKILRDPSLNGDGTRKALRLMCFMEQSIRQSPTAEKNHLRHEGFSDLKTELAENIELHASIDCLREALKITGPDAKNTVHPTRSILSLDGKKEQSPLYYAQELQEKYPELGEVLTRYLTTHQNKLQFRQTQHSMNPPRHARDKTDYSYGYTPKQWELIN